MWLEMLWGSANCYSAILMERQRAIACCKFENFHVCQSRRWAKPSEIQFCCFYTATVEIFPITASLVLEDLIWSDADTSDF
jgi:hypothetical protein